MLIDKCQTEKKGDIDLPKCQDETVFHSFGCLVEELAREEMENRFYSRNHRKRTSFTQIYTHVFLHVRHIPHGGTIY